MIYKVTNLINGKCYIGQTIRTLKERKSEHKRESKINTNNKFHNALKSEGFNNFKWEIIDNCNNQNNLDKLEEFYIKKYDSKKCGYNSTNGGTDIFGGGIREFFWNKATQEQRKQHSINISKAKKGKKQSEDFKKQKSQQWFNYWKDENKRKERSIKYSGQGNSNSKYYYEIYKNEKLILKTYNLREFCEINNFPLSYVKCCVRKNKKYKDYKIDRINYK